MMIKITKSCKEGGVTDGVINPEFITSALYVPEHGLTAVNMHNQPTIWVVESPDEIADMINEGEREMFSDKKTF